MTNIRLTAAMLCAIYLSAGIMLCAKENSVGSAYVTEITETAEYAQTNFAAKEADIAALSAKSFAADDDHIKPLGRSVFKDGIRKFTYTCSGIEFEFKGTSADIDVFCGGKARVAVCLNGNIVTDKILEKGDTTLKIFSSDVSQKCRISLQKLSSAGNNYVGVKNINVVSENDIAPTPEKEHRIEFIGDSITCGYGIDTDNKYYGFSGASENGRKTYAALISERFDAEYSICAWGGIGVYSSYTETSKPNRKMLIGEMYDKLGIYNETWDLSSQQPDLVIINVGTNDSTWTKGISEREYKFGKAYYELIEQIRKANPNAYIICTLGVMGAELMDKVREQTEIFCKNTGDDKIFCFEFEVQNTELNGYGTEYHPSAKTHEIMADALSEYISEAIGWK